MIVTHCVFGLMYYNFGIVVKAVRLNTTEPSKAHEIEKETMNVVVALPELFMNSPSKPNFKNSTTSQKPFAS